MAFDSEQRTIAQSALAALLVTISVLVAAGLLQTFEADEMKERLSLLAVALAPLALALLRDVAHLANHRFVAPLDRNAAAADTTSAKANMLSAILRNTHEQVTFAALVYAMAAIALPRHFTDAILACAALFVIGRLIFATGYAKGAGGRALGFGLTFYPSVALALLTAVTTIF